MLHIFSVSLSGVLHSLTWWCKVLEWRYKRVMHTHTGDMHVHRCSLGTRHSTNSKSSTVCRIYSHCRVPLHNFQELCTFWCTNGEEIAFMHIIKSFHFFVFRLMHISLRLLVDFKHLWFDGVFFRYSFVRSFWCVCLFGSSRALVSKKISVTISSSFCSNCKCMFVKMCVCVDLLWRVRLFCRLDKVLLLTHFYVSICLQPCILYVECVFCARQRWK